MSDTQDILERLRDLHRQATEERSHYYTGSVIRDAISTLLQVQGERDAAQQTLDEIKQWAKAYPLSVFPEPDLKKAHEVLKAAGMSLDQISASAMRHVLTTIRALGEKP